ncbi:MAG: cytochrome c [Verrucomicrobia bacterium]|nr:cytochrome c [Verrucomicrobiota bacterium]MBV9642565.1 cytochrome c [Verrucomicrobiota bacterium]
MKLLVTALVLSVISTGCRKGMVNQQYLKPLAEEEFFKDGSASRPIPPHTVARSHLNEDAHFFEGKIDGRLVTTFPAPVTREMIAHGREGFDIYCAVCHGRTGAGDGMIVQRGFPPPPSLHEERLRQAPVGHFFDVITNGYGIMYPYASRVTAADRWAIIAYIRALQLSQHSTLDDVEPAEREHLQTAEK